MDRQFIDGIEADIAKVDAEIAATPQCNLGVTIFISSRYYDRPNHR